MSISGQFYVRPAAGELIRAVFAPEPDDRAILLGRLTDGSGMRVQRGIYIYRATVSTNGGDEASITQRIAVASE